MNKATIIRDSGSQGFWSGVLVAAMLITMVMNGPGEVPRPEHPRPDAFRENWITLNGEWQFEIDDKADGEARGLISGKDLGAKIIVPFCPESKLSGLGCGNTRIVEACLVSPACSRCRAAMKGKRVRLHFGGGGLPGLGLCQRPARRHARRRQRRASVSRSPPAQGRRATNWWSSVFDDHAVGMQPSGKQAQRQERGLCSTRAPPASGSRSGWRRSARPLSRTSRSCPIPTTRAC